MLRVGSSNSIRSGFTILKFQMVLFECLCDKHGDRMTDLLLRKDLGPAMGLQSTASLQDQLLQDPLEMQRAILLNVTHSCGKPHLEQS